MKRVLQTSLPVLGRYRRSQALPAAATLVRRLGSSPTRSGELTDQQAVNNDSSFDSTLVSSSEKIDSSMLEAFGTALAPVLDGVQLMLETAHADLGLPWWAAIAGTTIVVRTAALPFVFYQIKATTRYFQAKPQLNHLKLIFKNSLEPIPVTDVSARWEKTKLYIKALRLAWKYNDCHPLKCIAGPLVQVPLFITFVTGTRRMINQNTVDGLSTGGLFWFTDLTAADATYVLPLVAVGMTFQNIQLSMGSGAQSWIDKLREILQFFCVLGLPFAVYLPQGVFMYWITSSSFSMAQILLLRQNSVRRVLGLPLIKLNGSGTASPGATPGASPAAIASMHNLSKKAEKASNLTAVPARPVPLDRSTTSNKNS